MKEQQTEVTDWLSGKFSFSKVHTAFGCMRKFFYRYVMKMKDAASPWFVVGQAVHTGQEADNNAKLEGKGLTLKQTLDAAVSKLEEARAEGGWKPKDIPTDPFVAEHTAQLEAYKRSGEWDKVYPAPGSVEAPFEIIAKVGDPEHGLEPAVIEGFVDVVSVDEEGNRKVIDYKTAGRPTKQSEADGHIQLALEAIGAQAAAGQITTFVKTGKQKPTTKVTEPTPSTEERGKLALKHMADGIHAIRRAVKTGDFPKCDPAAYYCQHGRGCEFGRLCFNTSDLKEFIQVEKLRPVGSLETPEWRKTKKT